MSKTHDYTNGNRRWGHDIGWKVLDAGAKRLDAHGWGVGIELGDYVLLSNGSGTLSIVIAPMVSNAIFCAVILSPSVMGTSSSILIMAYAPVRSRLPV